MEKKVIAHIAEYNLLVDSINRETKGSIPQCYYISGTMGMGKTQLLRQVEEAFREKEGVAVLFIDCLLAPMLAFEELKRKMLSIPSVERIILLLDEFHVLLSKWSKESLLGLRAMMFSENAPIMIAAGVGLPSQLTDYNEPLYDSLSLLSLKEISFETTIEIVKGEVDMPVTFLDTFQEVYNTIGGTPLVASLLAESLKKQLVTSPDIVRDAMRTLTPYYKGLLYDLSPIQRKIVLALLQSDDTVSLPELGELSGLKSSDITAQLVRLSKDRIVYMQKDRPKKSRYMLCDKLFRKWYACIGIF